MKIKAPKHWMNLVLDTSTIQEEVKRNAADIRTRRLGKSQELSSNAVQIQQEKSSITSLFSKTKMILNKIKVDATNKAALLQLFDDIESEYNDYEEQTNVLASRFKNSKIRILAFGSKSQGKSSFIQKFTKLGDDIVQTKKNGNRDKTGTTCIYYHKEGVSEETPEIRVIFREPEEIRNIINSCLQNLSVVGLQIDGNTHFSSWDDLVLVLNDPNKKKIAFDAITKLQQGNIKVSSFGAHKETLKSFFDPESDYSEINSSTDPNYYKKEEGKPISKSELPKYNDMQYKGGKRFQIVSEIHIYLDLGRSNMFNDIEICDTKGMSVEAGGSSWEEQLYKEIGKCDAAFSIQMDGSPETGKAAKEFYENLNNVMNTHPKDLKDMNLRHYIIWNACDNSDPIEVEEDANALVDYNFAQNLYIGALKDYAKYGKDTLDMQQFVDFVIYDMIKCIVVNTNETDKSLLEDLTSCKNKIEEHLKSLSKYLIELENDLPEKLLDWDDVLKKAILIQKRELEKEIFAWAEKENVTLPQRKNTLNQNTDTTQTTKSSSWLDDDDDNVDTFEENHEEGCTNEDISTIEHTPNSDEISRGVYRMLTNEELSKNECINNQEAVRKAIEKLFNKYIGKAGIKKGYYQTDINGTAQNIGAFIDHLSGLIFKEVNENINHCFIANSNNKNLSDFKNNLFGMIWDGLYLDNFCDQESFSIELLESMLRDDSKKNRLISKWVDCYKATGDNKAEGLYPRTSFSILKSYFEKVNEMPSETSLADTTLPIYDREKLKDAVVNAYEYHDYVTRYKQQINNDIKAKRSVLDITMSDMASEESYVEELFELYRILKPSEYNKILLECGLISDKEKEEFDNQECIKNFKDLKQQLISYKTSL